MYLSTHISNYFLKIGGERDNTFSPLYVEKKGKSICGRKEISQFLAFKIVHSIPISLFPKVTIDSCNLFVVFIMFPYLPVKSHDQFCEILIIIFPVFKGSLKGILGKENS